MCRLFAFLGQVVLENGLVHKLANPVTILNVDESVPNIPFTTGKEYEINKMNKATVKTKSIQGEEALMKRIRPVDPSFDK